MSLTASYMFLARNFIIDMPTVTENNLIKIVELEKYMSINLAVQ